MKRLFVLWKFIAEVTAWFSEKYNIFLENDFFKAICVTSLSEIVKYLMHKFFKYIEINAFKDNSNDSDIEVSK